MFGIVDIYDGLFFILFILIYVSSPLSCLRMHATFYYDIAHTLNACIRTLWDCNVDKIAKPFEKEQEKTQYY